MMKFDVLSIFPGMFAGPLGDSIMKRAQDEGLLQIRYHDLRDYTLDKHKRVDDSPFGGGAGMIMNVEPIVRAIEEVKKDRPKAHTILLSPGGSKFDQAKAQTLSELEEIILVCGRYEGVDERVHQNYVDEELSIGDYVLSGGEVPAMVIIEAVSRLLPGVLGHEEALTEESFNSPMLEYPQYTRPREFRGISVPEILLSGHHENIRAWQREEALKKTARQRPDLLDKLDLTEQDRIVLGQKNIG
jgi:tRNA (guanine37-N1)-methyltransferase